MPITSFAGVLLFSISQNLIGYNWQICEVVENSLVGTYGFYMDVIYLLSILIFAVWSIYKGKGRRKEITIASVGVSIFIVLFFVMEYVFTGYLLSGVFDYNYFLYAFFGMPILIGFLAYLVIKYQEFDVKLLATQVLVWALVILIGAEFFFIQSNVNKILTAITLIISAWLGLSIINSVKKEVKAKENERLQRQKFEELANRFENINHILAHDIKNTLGKDRDLFVEMQAGTFGEITDQGKSFIKRLTVDTADLITSVTNILKSGDKMKPDIKPFDFKTAVLDVVASVKDKADEQKIKIEVQVDEKEDYTVNADRSLIVPHVLKNLIENAVNYNVVDGSIWINLSKKDPKTVLLSIKGTGWGMTEDDKKVLFKAGGHGPDSIKKNVHTSGFGLFIAKQTLDAHHGKVYGISEGRGQGSTFFVELPVGQTVNESLKA
ncbi:MAG: MFS domain-containing histidine kinase [Candidatus Nomurabacteria bacterium]|nr:MFS domain-containing histidine kinase [Candidatus Nomurabacteria bacterium]